MQITLTLPDELARQIQILPDRDRFIREALLAAMQQRKAHKPLSKWARIALCGFDDCRQCDFDGIDRSQR